MTGIALPQLARFLGSRWPANVAVHEATGVSIDSRSLCPGMLFWALPGRRTHGREFLSEAAQRGAVAAVSDRPSAAGLPVITVPDTHEALLRAAGWYRSLLTATVVGVTGSAGKTMTKELIALVLGEAFRVAKSPANQNNLVGLPVALLNARRDHEVLILEHGTSGVGEIRELAALSRPSIGVITCIGPAHLAGLGNVRGVLQEKLDLLRVLPRDGAAVINADDPHLRAAAAQIGRDVLWYGFGPAAGRLGLRAGWWHTEAGVHVQVGSTRLSLPAFGRPYAYAALVALCVARLFGISDRRTAQALRTFRPPEGRLRVVREQQRVVIDDCYNANPLSLQACVELLVEVARRKGWRKVLVLGDMLELGEEAERWHRSLGRRLAPALDVVIAVGPLAGCFAEAARRANATLSVHVATDPLEAAELCRAFGEQCVIAVKASRGMRLEQTVERLLDGCAERFAA